MGRIPQDQVERLKALVDLSELVRSRGVELKRHGKDLIGHCPFHDDRTPSFIVTPSKNLWHCMGACQAGGSVIDFVMRADGVSFREALEVLGGGHALEKRKTPVSKEKKSLSKISTAEDFSALMNPEADAQELLQATLRHYEWTMREHGKEAMEYLESRGIANAEAIARFRIGFADRHHSLAARIPAQGAADGKAMRARLTECGILRESGHEAFAASVVFPILGQDGVIKGMYGRKLTDHLRPGSIYHSYLAGPHRGVWNLEAFGNEEIILCEAIIDAMTFWVNGYRNVTAAYGVSGFTEHHWNALREMKVRRVTIAYDRDEAGDKAAAELAERLTAEDIEVYRVLFPKGMDANEYACKMTPAPAALKICLESALVMKGTVKGVRNYATFSSLAAPLPPGCEVPAGVQTAEEAAMAAAPPEVVAEAAVAAQEIPVEARGEDIFVKIEGREYRVRGFKKNLAYEVMKINLRMAVGDAFHIDTLDLYQAKARTAFVAAGAEALNVAGGEITRDMGRLLMKLEELQDEEMKRVLTRNPVKAAVVISEEDREAALTFLRQPDLVGKILTDLAACGVVGEETNKCVAYLACVSRKLETPLAVVIQSSSAAGKSSLMEAVLAMVPDEDKVSYSAMTGQSLFYMGETDLKNKCLAIAEEEGARHASYALKLLQSEGEIKIASTGKDAHTGKLVTHQYRVAGPTMIFLTTTAIEIDEELMNRCLVLTVNETREQTRMIHDLQRRAQTLDGLIARQKRAQVLRLHQNAQRLLRPLLVANPFAEKLTFLDSRTRTRRDHMKYLTLIRVIALLHQHSREVKSYAASDGEVVEYIEVEPRDIELANTLCHQVLGRSLDELPPQTRKLLQLIAEMVAAAGKEDRKNYRFTRREVREFTGWSDFQVHVHMTKLVALEYVLPHRGGRGSQFVYELLFDGGEGAAPTLPGLLDPRELTAACIKDGHLTHRLLHEKGEYWGSISPQLAPILGGYRSVESGSGSGSSDKNAGFSEKTHMEGHENGCIKPEDCIKDEGSSPAESGGAVVLPYTKAEPPRRDDDESGSGQAAGGGA